jgi:flagellar export protein FliJ
LASFQYGFQKVVDLKTSEKSQAEWLLSQSLGVLSAEEQSLRQLLETKREWEQKLQEAAGNAVPLAQLQLIGQYLDHLQSCIANKTKDVQRAQKQVDGNRANLAERMKDEKIWLKAKDHAFERFCRAMRLKEQNELDELAAVRFVMPSAP